MSFRTVVIGGGWAFACIVGMGSASASSLCLGAGVSATSAFNASYDSCSDPKIVIGRSFVGSDHNYSPPSDFGYNTPFLASARSVVDPVYGYLEMKARVLRPGGGKFTDAVAAGNFRDKLIFLNPNAF